MFPERETALKPFNEGTIVANEIESVSEIISTNLPPIPKMKKSSGDRIKLLNSQLASAEPWIIGTYESIMVSEHLKTKKFESKNRIILILVDSSIEIAFKDYLTYKVPTHYSNTKLTSIFEKRHLVVAEVKNHCGSLIKPAEWTQLSYFYGLRCDLTHKRSSAGISNADINKFIKLGKRIHSQLLGIKYPKNDE
ncbi:MAG: hypothetical protein JJT94_17760 [Bernardetiaceae bacterium]|nr:hypothetical protein [Bernardetiaceae bacterium]